MADLEYPADRDHFFIAFICALNDEYDAATLLLDRSYTDEGQEYSRALGDTNHYTTGCISGRHVVIVLLPYMGPTSASASASGLRRSYKNLKLAFIVGVCGGVPRGPEGRDAFLGDVVIGTHVLQTDSGRLYHNGLQARRDIEDVLGRASRDISGLLALLNNETNKKQLTIKSAAHLRELQSKAWEERERSYEQPDLDSDVLFAPTNVHKHRDHDECTKCASDPAASCESARQTACWKLDCNRGGSIARSRPFNPMPAWRKFGIFFGRIGSGNQVIKSGSHRDEIAAQHNLIAFEMEGAGVWDELPCIVVKGICDYADSHKTKQWRLFAASRAAAVAKALLEKYSFDDSTVAPQGKRKTAVERVNRSEDSKDGQGKARGPSGSRQVEWGACHVRHHL